MLAGDPRFVREALIAIEETGRSAMEELDYVLGLLRDPDASGRAPQRTLADLEGLLTDARSTGLSVAAVCEGPLDKVSPAVSREAFRIVQEGLTNVAKHAPGSPIQLRIAVGGETLAIELTNPADGDVPPPRNGSGLTGMHERVSLLGGRFSAERDGSQWRVKAQLPTGRSTR
jgi:signal transduction histidine kinase